MYYPVSARLENSGIEMLFTLEAQSLKEAVHKATITVVEEYDIKSVNYHLEFYPDGSLDELVLDCERVTEDE